MYFIYTMSPCFEHSLSSASRGLFMDAHQMTSQFPYDEHNATERITIAIVSSETFERDQFSHAFRL